jgi:hypothetical protein
MAIGVSAARHRGDLWAPAAVVDTASRLRPDAALLRPRAAPIWRPGSRHRQAIGHIVD